MKKRLIIYSLLSFIATYNLYASDDNWNIIGDGNVLMPLSSVRCLVGSDVTGLITVVGSDATITDIGEVTFSNKQHTSIHKPYIASDSVTLNDNLLSLKCITPGSTLSIITVDGHKVFSTKLTENHAEIDFSNYTPGVYLVTIGNSRFKLMKR